MGLPIPGPLSNPCNVYDQETFGPSEAGHWSHGQMSSHRYPEDASERRTDPKMMAPVRGLRRKIRFYWPIVPYCKLLLDFGTLHPGIYCINKRTWEKLGTLLMSSDLNFMVLNYFWALRFRHTWVPYCKLLLDLELSALWDLLHKQKIHGKSLRRFYIIRFNFYGAELFWGFETPTLHILRPFFKFKF